MNSLCRTTHLIAPVILMFAAGTCCLSGDAISQEVGHEKAAQERARPDQENQEIATVRRRLKVMRTAVKAFMEAENKKAAELVERAMHARELAIEGVRTEEARRVAEAAPNRGQLAEHLAAASNLYEKWGMPDRAEALVALAEVYGQQWRRQQRAQQQGRPSERQGQHQHEGQGQEHGGLDSLERRVKILALAREAHDRAGHERAERALAAAVRYGKLTLEGAGEEALAIAAEGLPSIGNLIELLQGANKMLAESGMMEPAVACGQLAEFYARRERERRAEAGQERDRPRRGNLEDRGQRIEILRMAQVAHREGDNRRAAGLMEKVLHLAELQLEGAGGDVVARAAEGLTQGMIIELVQAAAGLYARWGDQERAGACRRLAEFYRARAAGAEVGTEREPVRERDTGRQAVIRELHQRLERLQQELKEIQVILRRLER